MERRAFYLRTSFNTSLIESLKYLLDVCNEVIPVDLLTKATQKLNTFDPHSKLSGLLGLIHVKLFNAAEQEDIQKVNTIVEKLVQDTFQSEGINYINLSNLNDYYVPFVKKIFSEEITRSVQWFFLSSKEFEDVKLSLQKGLDVIKEAFPDFYTELQELISEVLIIKAEGLVQGSGSDFFGMIYKSSLSPWDKITDVLEFFIHEQSHLYVYLLNKDDPLVLNSKEIHESPFRKEKRPLMGIYHAVFILARVLYVFERALALNKIPQHEKEYCQQLSIDYKNYFLQCFGIVETHAQMTPLGEGLILSASKLVA